MTREHLEVNRRPRLAAALVTASLLVLTGCAGSGPRPGVAVAVDDQVITTAEVDTAARGLCNFFADDIAQQQGAVANLAVRQNVAALLALRSAVGQLAEEVGAEPGPDYRRQANSLEDDTADVEPADEREALVDAVGAEPYVLALVPRIGETLLRDEGTDDPEPEESARRGLEALTTFLAEGGVEFDPALGLAYRDVEIPDEGVAAALQQVIGALFEIEDTSTSVGVSGTAESALEPDADYAASLPANQRCGG